MKLIRSWLAWASAYGIASVLAIGVSFANDAAAQTVRVDVTPAHAIKFDPDAALGSSMDILPHNLVDTVYSEPVLKESLSAGWGPITYRQNTELTVAAWHWNSNGTWSDEALDKQTSGLWTTFPSGEVQDGKGGTVLLKLSSLPVRTRYLRVWMTESSNACDTHGSNDPRNCAGYAMNEIYAGNFTAAGEFVDLIVHAPGQNQTPTFVSSMDPWHTAADIDQRRDQTGFDLFFTSGITNHLPAMIPVSLLYGTPEDAAAELAYLEKRGYPISYVEIGEEPDGKKTMPEDYGALYVQWADALHHLDPRLKLGGPIFEGVNEDIKVWPDSRGRTSWMGRFIDYLKERGRLNDLAFVSFEHYPFPPCEVTWADLYREPELVRHILQVWRDDGVPKDIPLMITESNLSWALTEPMTDLFAALWLADNAGSFLASGGAVFYHSPIQPEPLHSGCHGWSTYGNFVANEKLEISQHTSQYFASRMINLEWVKHGGGTHQLAPAFSDISDDAGHTLITAYAAKRPD